MLARRIIRKISFLLLSSRERLTQTMAVILLCSQVSVMQSCKQSSQKEILTERQIELRNELAFWYPIWVLK